MYRIWKILRVLVSLLLLVAVGVPALLYVLLSIDSVQNNLREVVQTEFSRQLGAKVTIGRFGVRPFSRVTLADIALTDSSGTDTIATIERVSAGIETARLLRSGDIVVDFALIDGLHCRLWREAPDSPLNIAPIVEHIKANRNQNREEKPFELSINSVIVRRGGLDYDVRDAAPADSGHFDRNHIRLRELAINAFIPEISNNNYSISLDHLSAHEQSGLAINRLRLQAHLGNNLLHIAGLELETGRTNLSFDTIVMPVAGDIRHAIASHPLRVRTLGNCRLFLPDFAPLESNLGKFGQPLSLDLDVQSDLRSVNLERLVLRHGGDNTFAFAISAEASGLDSLPELRFRTHNVAAIFDGRHLSSMLSDVLPAKHRQLLARVPLTAIEASAEGTPHQFKAGLRTAGAAGNLRLEGNYRKNGRRPSIEASLEFSDLALGMLTANDNLGTASGSAHADIQTGRITSGEIDARLESLEFRGYPYRNLTAEIRLQPDGLSETMVNLDDPAANVHAYVFFDRAADPPALSATAALANVDLQTLGISDIKPGYRFGAKLVAETHGDAPDNLAGTIDITDVRWLDNRNHGLRLPRLSISADPEAAVPTIILKSDILNGRLMGHYSFRTLLPELRHMAAYYLPSVLPENSTRRASTLNDFAIDIQIEPTEEISRFFNLPVAIVHPATITGRVDTPSARAYLEVDAPYLLQGNKIYDHTTIYACLDSAAYESMLYLTTQFPTKKGDMGLSTVVRAFDNRVDTHVDWTIQRRIPLNGTFDFSTELLGLTSASPEGKALSPVEAVVNFNPGTVNFGNETWCINPSKIVIGASSIDVENFALEAESQRIAIDGIISGEPADVTTIDLSEIELLSIFETLEIDKAMIGGRATGTFTASSLLTSEPVLQCDNLHVDSIGYNRCTIGDADILARWDREHRSFFLDADITGDTGEHSRISGHIMPFSESLDLNFQARNVPVGFLKPFMEAFARDISGRASGDCRLFGTFSEIDLTGDIFARDVTLAIDFTNSSYTTTDSVHMTPGRIIVPKATVYDAEGHTAKISGWVGHKFFKEPSFRFDVTEATNFLSYNGTPAQNPDWFGTIYGNGTASVYGEPGVVNIEADMSTAPRSTFTFVLSDRLDAVDYSFINFRDVTPDSLRVAVETVDDVPVIVREIQERLHSAAQEEVSDYKMKISVDLNPNAALTLVMDPLADDAIHATGNGHVTMSYDSSDEDLRIYGAYSVLEGRYRFTLQDIIIKDFTIKEGSTINFDGDPYAIRSDLQAYYATNANLSDLDESFLQDRDVARTKVPVHALMKVHGDIRQPDISFDLEFPTLTSDTYRKVRSIVSTNDMMNRQIIYLLALNRFYTPDYMNAKGGDFGGGELFSVASSTISSQLSSLLGKLSDKWSIAPNFRTDRGDFSDVEVDLALSSRLLNNRLLFNGNFGYRDKSMNSNQFVGDFDIEYLLNKRGSWRLKAYNRYNDANYYLRSAATTQGVGIMYRRDFDNIFSFLRPKKKKPAQTTAAPADSTSAEGNK